MVILLLASIFPFFFHPCLVICLFVAGLTWVSVSFLKKIIYLFLCFWLCWVFFLLRGLSLVAESEDYSLAVVCRFLIVVVSLVSEHWV